MFEDMVTDGLFLFSADKINYTLTILNKFVLYRFRILHYLCFG